MQLLTLATLLVAGSATAFAGAVEKRANLKVNEFTSPDCNPDSASFGHTAAVAVVNMDPTSHSVYLAGGAFAAYSAFSPNAGGAGCTGDFLGDLPGACSNLDTAFAQRINCVSTT